MNKILLGITVLMALCGGVFFWYQNTGDRVSILQPAATSTAPSDQTQSPQDYAQYVGQITTDANGDNVYTSIKYGLSFTYPKGWRVGDNHLGYGTLQLLNYDDATSSSGSVFGVDQNKIEAMIATGNLNDIVSMMTEHDPGADYPIDTFSNVHMTIAGQDAIKTSVRLVGGDEYVTYYIPVGSMSNVVLHITVYGDSSHFNILDQVVQSIKFTTKQ